MTLPAGLCDGCRWGRPIRARRGSQFWLCARHTIDDRFRKYPVLPVLDCSGYEPSRDRDGEEAQE